MLLVVIITATAAPRTASAQSDAVRLLRSESRSPYVHRLTLYDAEGKAISPDDESARPYSPKATCAKCHEYGRVAGEGWHFNACAPDIDPGRPGEPWILTDTRFGISIPLSARKWPGVFSPQQVGLTPFQFVLNFGRHLPGGGFGELGPADYELTPEAKRWALSGQTEIDCMICHAAGNSYDPAEVDRQIERENFAWIPTAALGLALVRGEAKRVPDDFDPAMPPPGQENSYPKVMYDRSRFDGDNRVLFDLTRRPSPDRCYYCHTTRPVGEAAPPRWQTPGDVHIAAGLSCTDCHRNDIGHAITRGYEPPASPDDVNLARASLTCEGCHLGWSPRPADDHSDRTHPGLVERMGAYAAPTPRHDGIPPLHFEKLTCTACHSGPLPDLDATQRVQTSMAHRLGIGSKERRDTDAPQIVEPVFAHDPWGRIAPHRATLPAYWGVLKGAAIDPLPLDVVRRAGEKIVPKPKRGSTAPPPEPLSDELIGKMLEALNSAAAEGQPAYLRDGHVYRLAPDGTLQKTTHAAAAEVRWPLAHDVRPASQALGARGCTDCHADDAAIFFGAAGLVKTSGYDPTLARVWSLGFEFRPAVFWALLAACIALTGVLLAWLGDGLRSLLRR